MREEERIGVAHIGPDARGRGGMAAVTRALMETDLRHDFDLVAITTHRPGSRAARLLTFVRGYGTFVRWARRPGTRIAHIHCTVRGSLHRKLLMVATAKALGVPVVLHVHAGAAELVACHEGLGSLRRRAARARLRATDRVLAVSRASAEVLERRFGADQVEVLPNPAPRLAPSANGSPGPAEILYLGGFANPVKGGDILLRALPAVRAEVPDARVTLAGPGELLDSTLGSLAGDPLVDRAGYLDENAKRAALRRASVVVLPSTSEGMPMTLLEAMAAGAPIVASRVGGIPDVAVDGSDALLLDPGDPAALAAAITTLLNDSDRAKRLGEAARKRAAALCPDVIARRLDAIYRELAARA